MADAFSDARLELILVSVGEHLVVDAPRAPAARAGSPWPRRLAIAAAILVAVVVDRGRDRAGPRGGCRLARHRAHADRRRSRAASTRRACRRSKID